jgi:hypothetical protein
MARVTLIDALDVRTRPDEIADDERRSTAERFALAPATAEDDSDRETVVRRPQKAKDSFRFAVRGTTEEIAAWKAAAKAEGLPVGAWIRKHVNAGVKPASRICPECGETFPLTHPFKRYCSLQCRTEHRKREVTALRTRLAPRPCAKCTAMFQPITRANVYCDSRCARAAQRPSTTSRPRKPTEPAPTRRPRQPRILYGGDCSPQVPALNLKQAAGLLAHAGVAHTGIREWNRSLVYDLQSAADGLDRRQIGDLMDYLKAAADKAGVLRLVNEPIPKYGATGADVPHRS